MTYTHHRNCYSQPIDREEFDDILENLPHARKKVLYLFLAGKGDDEIAKELSISRVTVRNHLLNARKNFLSARRSATQDIDAREDLIDLFRQFKKEAIGAKWRTGDIDRYINIQDISSSQYLQQGVNHFNRKDFQRAIDSFKTAIESDLRNPIARIFLNNAIARAATTGQGNLVKIAVVISYVHNSIEQIEAAKNVLRGVADAQTEFNRHPKTRRYLEIAIANDRNQREEAQRIATDLCADASIFGAIGHHSSEGTEAALPVYERSNVPIISPTSTSSKLAGTTFFRAIGSTKIMAGAYADYLLTSNFDRVVVLYHKNNIFSQALKDDFETVFRSQGGKIIRSLEYLNHPNPDFRGLLKYIKTELESKAVLAISSIETNEAAISIAAENRHLSCPLKLLFSTAMTEGATIEKGLDAVEGAIFLRPDLSAVNDYIDRAKQSWKQAEINWRVATSYRATKALIQAIDRPAVPTRQSTLDDLRDRWNARSEYQIVRVENGEFRSISKPL